MAKSPKQFLAEFGNRVTIATNKVAISNDTILSRGSDLYLQPNSGIYANGNFGTAGQVLTSSGANVYWSTVSGGGGGETVNTAAQYTWTNTHTFTVDTFFSNGLSYAKITNGDIPSIGMANVVGWYVPSDRSFSAMGTKTSQIIFLNSDSSPGAVLVGEPTILTDLSLSKGIYANNTLGTAGQVLSSDGSKAYWGNDTGSIGPVSGGTSITNIPAKARKISVVMSKVTGTSNMYIQMSYDGNWVVPTSSPGYSSVHVTPFSPDGVAFFQGIGFAYGFFIVPCNGVITFERLGASTVWSASGVVSTYSDTDVSKYKGTSYTGGSIDLNFTATNSYGIRIFNGSGGNYSVNWYS